MPSDAVVSALSHHVVFELRAVDPVPPRVGTSDAPATVPDGAHGHTETHLVWWFRTTPGCVEAHYRFDEAYAHAHPECVDPAHLAMLHALLTFKLFDDGDVLVPPKQLLGVLRWPRFEERRRPLAMSEI